MKTRLEDVLSGQEENYILPFLWQRGEDEATIREEMKRVAESGIHAVCVEARPHPDFLGERWWRDMDIIMEEARQRRMRVWVLDDDHFPTGHAAGKVEGAPDELQRLFLRERHMDVLGPQKNASLLVKPWLLNLFRPEIEPGTEMLAVVAYRRAPESDQLGNEWIDLTANIQEDILYWDIPAGYWRVFYLFTSRSGGSEHHKTYLNPLIPESTQILLDAVYEPFYSHYGADFGQTFAGFFSDEPGFYNDKDTFDYNSTLGKKDLALPWRPGLLDLLADEGGSDYKQRLPLLWHDGGEATAAARYTYMDVVSRLYGQNFTQVLGDWCRAHQIEYIGHVLEDNGSHTHLGCGAGHYFRALWGQDMAGLDIVLWQVVPGFDTGPFTNVSGDADGEFYHYGLAKLGSSLAHLDPKKHGRSMCELFGAYGWREGLKLMKWMTDHLLVRGTNYFVPHAFSQAEFPDPDCPPHFFARGKNPQYRHYRELNLYTNRVSHLLSGGQHIAPAAVLYHADAEWAGDAMPFQKPVRVLAQHQIDCDVVPGDLLLQASAMVNDRLVINEETYSVLVIPTSQILPGTLLQRLLELADGGLPIIFIDRLPERSTGSRAEVLASLAGHARVQVAALDQLAQRVQRLGCCEITSSSYQPYLRSFHVHHPGMEVYFLTNEHPYQVIDTRITLPGPGPVLAYDAFRNSASSLASQPEGEGVSFDLQLSPYESQLVILGEAVQKWATPVPTSLPQPVQQAIAGPWAIALATAQEYPAWTAFREQAGLLDLSQPGLLPAFSGVIRYSTVFNLAGARQQVRLDLGEVYETAEVWVNRQPAGVRICPPYQFDISAYVKPGENELVIEVTNTLVKEQRDFLSRYSHQEPSGLIGPVLLRLVN